MTHPPLATEPHAPTGQAGRGHGFETLQNQIEYAAHFLPSQGPIEVFVHHNTLHVFEDLPFHQALKTARKLFKANCYLPEAQYREMLLTERILISDLELVLRSDLAGRDQEPIDGLGTRYDLRLAMLKYPLRTGPESELHWVMAETDALTRFRPEAPALACEQMLEGTKQAVRHFQAKANPANGSANELLASLRSDFGQGDVSRWRERQWTEFTLRYLWRVCRQGVHAAGNGAKPARPVRGRDLLLAATGEDTDRYVHDLLIRFTSAFVDQGFAAWEMPERDQGLYRAFLSLYSQPAGPPDRWLRGLAGELRKLTASQTGPLASIENSLELLGILPDQREEFLTQSLLALGGWAGMVWQLETAADWVNRPVPPGTLIEFLAVRLILERQAIAYVAQEAWDFEEPLSRVADVAWKHVSHQPEDGIDHRAFLVFQIAQMLGWRPDQLQQLSRNDWRLLIDEMLAFDEQERQRLYHEAYERKYHTAALDALSIHTARRRMRWDAPSKSKTAARPSFQISCCLDDREESFRRHLEEIDPRCETFSAAGFFAVVMNYQGVADARYKPLCPIILTPKHFVKEDVGYPFEGEHRRQAETRRVLGRVTHQVQTKSRTFIGGIVTGLMGSLATFPLVARVLFPRLTARIRRRFGELLQPPPVTQLQLERVHPDPGAENGHIGYTLEEMVDIVERCLLEMGLTKNFARLVVITGHGSSSVNNPHASAYNCGACAGKRGGPNARAFSQMANDWRVRFRLIERGIRIPEDTWFVGTFHNTCEDSIVWYDLDRLPAWHREDFRQTKLHVDEARRRNAHERSRRFGNAELSFSPEEALRHVEERAEDLAQPRPEYNHATNAITMVGRREWSRGLYLDRRTFLTSYDPAVDDEEHTVLLRILSAAIPVCAGISLEYYFSCVDNVVWGSGSKLPHNLVSMLGVMEGAASDLRTGLYQQMIEIHEPMRQLFVIETTPEIMQSIMDRHPGIARLCRGDWVKLALLDPATSEILVFRDGQFEPYEPSPRPLPRVKSSAEWYQGQREHLGFATIEESASSS